MRLHDSWSCSTMQYTTQTAAAHLGVGKPAVPAQHRCSKGEAGQIRLMSVPGKRLRASACKVSTWRPLKRSVALKTPQGPGACALQASASRPHMSVSYSFSRFLTSNDSVSRHCCRCAGSRAATSRKATILCTAVDKAGTIRHNQRSRRQPQSPGHHPLPPRVARHTRGR